MAVNYPRRRFLTQTVGSLSSASLLPGLGAVSRAGMSLDQGVVKFQPEVEPLVRLIEDTPRSRLMEEVGQRVHDGTGYRDVLTALFLAAIRNVEPRPAVGFKFHAVLVVHASHLASISSPNADRWLPIFWALDEFKSSQARDVQENDWTMGPVDEAAVPNARRAREDFHAAMQDWDEGKVDAAAAGLVRFTGATEVFESFARYAARDYRSIGHKAIFAANAWRTLQTIGWQHAEPVFRSLAYAMVNHNGEPNPATSDLHADRPWRQNTELASTIRDNWQYGRLDQAAAQSLLETLRTGTSTESSAAAAEMLNLGVSPQSVFDALHTAATEMLLKQSGIIALHAVTTTNAIRFLFDATGNEHTRRMLLLQNAAFLPMFRVSMQRRGRVRSTNIDAVMAASADGESMNLERIFDNVGKNPLAASRGVFGYVDDGRDARTLISAARRMIFLKGSNAHDYKFSSALLEDYYKVSPGFRNQFLAAGSTMLRGSSSKDNGLVGRIRAALS
ncbi:MAG: hypothetical protein MK102_02800 [Fuerstiella sp.]|nr:hypothetical protein [Fuerstiella sp.]